MCNQESHHQLAQGEHLSRHTIAAETARNSFTLRGLGSVSVEKAMEDASEALKLIECGVLATPECVEMLRSVVKGDLQKASA